MALNELASNLKMPAMLYFKVMRILKRNATARYFNFMDQGILYIYIYILYIVRDSS